MWLAVEEMLVWLIVDELGGQIVVGSSMGFSEGSGKSSHTVSSHSRSISEMSFYEVATQVMQSVNYVLTRRLKMGG